MALRCNSKALASRFAAGRPGKRHNAEVVCVQYADHTEVTYMLHSTAILRGTKYPTGQTRLCLLNWGGWFTTTTQKHINSVLRELDLPTVSRTNWRNCPATISTAGRSSYVVHWAEYYERAWHVRGCVLHCARDATQPLRGLLGWLHRCDHIAVQGLSSYDFSQGMDGALPEVVQRMLGTKRRKVYYNGPTARSTGVTK